MPARQRPDYCRGERKRREHGRRAVAKGQKRSNREVKKPKADKKKVPATAAAGTAAPPARPKVGAAIAGSKK